MKRYKFRIILKENLYHVQYFDRLVYLPLLIFLVGIPLLWGFLQSEIFTGWYNYSTRSNHNDAIEDFNHMKEMEKKTPKKIILEN